MKTLAKIVSAFTHPLFLLNFGLFSLFRYHPYYRSKIYDEQFYQLSLFIFITTLLMPLLSVYLLKRFQLISDYSISDPKERIMPYTTVALILGIAAYKLFKGEVYGVPIHFLLATILCIVINLLFNIRFKISSHAIGCGGLIGLYLFLSLHSHLVIYHFLLLVAIVLAGITGWARLATNSHTEKEVYSGYAVGLLLVLGFLFIGASIH